MWQLKLVLLGIALALCILRCLWLAMQIDEERRRTSRNRFKP